MSKATTRLRCECGGALRKAELDDFDFSPYAGLPVRLKFAPGYRCDRCGGETLRGDVINAVLRGLALRILREPERLSGARARYLRRFLRLNQADLADRMGLNRVTVAKWESGADVISPAHDLVLRALVVASLDELPEGAASILGQVCKRQPTRTRRLAPFDASEGVAPRRAGGPRRARSDGR